MADISKLKLPNGTEYDLKVYTNHIAPMMSKTFQGVVGTANTDADCTFFFGTIRPTDYYDIWKIKYKVHVHITGTASTNNKYAQARSEVTWLGSENTYQAYHNLNHIHNTSYRPVYYNTLYNLKKAGYDAGLKHAIGIGLRNSWNPYNASYPREVTVQILQCINCQFTFLDNMIKWSSLPNYNTTNYETYRQTDFCNNGLYETGDTNDVNYQNRLYYSNPGLKAYAAGGRYTLTFTKDDNYVLPITATDNSTSGGAKVYTTESFDPFGQIYYRYASGTIAANAQIANATLYRQILVDARYSFTGVLNGASSVMSANNPVYLVCTPQEDGSAKLAENPLSFELPNSEDGLYYILLGYAYNTYQFELLLNNPVYMFKKGRIREVSNYAHCAGDATTVNGYEPVNKAGDIMSGNLVVPAIRAANTYYGVSFGRTTATAKETLFHTGIRWISSKHMPVIHITGFAYGLSSLVEFKIGFYIYGGQVVSRGVVNMGSWAPQVYIFKLIQNENEYVSIGFKGSCYFLQLSADIQDEMGKFTGIDMTADLWSWEFLTNEGNIPESDGGTSCAIAPYKADILNPSKVNNHTINSDVPSNAKFTDTTYESKTAVQNGTDVSLVTTGEKYNWNSKTSNTGTVTKVTAGTGLSIGSTAGGNFTTSGTINHTNAITAQNTQAIYPIKIDAQGHISAYGSAVTPLTASSTLDATKLNGTIPTACLPSYVDDVLQYTAKANFPTTGEAGKIYVDKTTNLTWRWGGSSYVEISPSLALGTTSSTAFRGDYGNTAYTHATDSNRLTTATSSGLYKIASTAQGHIASLTAVQKSDITGLGIPDTNTITTATTTGNGNAVTSVTASNGALTVAKDSTFLTSHQTMYEAKLVWGGQNFSGSYGCIDAAMIGSLGANRFAFLKAAGLTIEYSTDGGTNWVDYGASNENKTGLFGKGYTFYLGKHSTNGSSTLNDMFRVTIATGAAQLYTTLNKIAIYMSTAGNTVQVKMEKALENTPTNFITHLDWTGISGWSGWNILNISNLTTYGNSPASQYGRIRFIFKQTAINNGSYPAANITRIMGFGGVGWTVPSNMAADGHLYSYDNAQNATFPAKVTATQFDGNATNVTGIVAIDHGGTGKTTANDAANALLAGLPDWTADPSDDVKLIRRDTGNSSAFGQVKFSTVWNYIKTKISSILGLTATTYGGSAAKVNNHTVNSDVPANAVFTDTVTTVTTSGSGNAVTAISASNGAVTATKGTTFLTSHQDISGKADKSATVSTVTWDSTNKKLTKTINGTTTDVVTAATLRTGLNVANGAEVNQNAFSNVKVGSTTIAADAKTDTVELVAGSNITLTPDATNDKITIAATDTTYTAATAAPLMDGTAAVGTSAKYARENHVHPTDTSRAPVSHASTATTYGIGTNNNYGHVKLSDTISGSAAAASGGTAATPKAVSDAKTAAINHVIVSATQPTSQSTGDIWIVLTTE